MSVICTMCARLVFPNICMVHVQYCGQIDVSVQVEHFGVTFESQFWQQFHLQTPISYWSFGQFSFTILWFYILFQISIDFFSMIAMVDFSLFAFYSMKSLFHIQLLDWNCNALNKVFHLDHWFWNFSVHSMVQWCISKLFFHVIHLVYYCFFKFLNYPL